MRMTTYLPISCRLVRFIFAAITVCSLAACSGGGGGDSPAQPQSSAAVSDNHGAPSGASGGGTRSGATGRQTDTAAAGDPTESGATDKPTEADTTGSQADSGAADEPGKSDAADKHTESDATDDQPQSDTDPSQASDDPANPVTAFTISAPIVDTFGHGPSIKIVATASNAEQVTWSKDGHGSLDRERGDTVVYTPPATVDAPEQVTIKAFYGANEQSVTVTLHPPTLNPIASPTHWFVGDPPIELRATPAFVDGPVSWKADATGTFSATTGEAVTFAPGTVTKRTSATITATANQHSESQTVTLEPADAKKVVLSSNEIRAGSARQITASVEEKAAQGALTWSTKLGEVVASGNRTATYTPPLALEQDTTIDIVATDEVKRTFTASILVLANGDLSLGAVGGTTQFGGESVPLTAKVLHGGADEIVWHVDPKDGSLSKPVASGHASTVSYYPPPTAPVGTVSTVKITASIGNVTKITTVSIGFRSTASFLAPQGLAVADDNTLFVADSEQNLIRKISADGTVSVFSGSGISGWENGTPDEARYEQPLGIAFNADGELYVADSGNRKIRVVSTDGSVNTPAIEIKNGPFGVRFDAAGKHFHYLTSSIGGIGYASAGDDGYYSAYLAQNQSLLALFHPDSQKKITIAGGGDSLEDESIADKAKLGIIDGIAIDKNGVVYFADKTYHVIRKVADGKVVTVAGKMGTPGAIDGVGTSARFKSPTGLTFGADGTLYVSDAGNHLIRAILPTGSVVTVAGGGDEARGGTALPR